MDAFPWLAMPQLAAGVLSYGTIWRLTAHLKEIAPSEWDNLCGPSFHARFPGIAKVGSMKQAITDIHLILWIFTKYPMIFRDDETAILAWMARVFLVTLLILVFVVPFIV